jgi:hypothetical protein
MPQFGPSLTDDSRVAFYDCLYVYNKSHTSLQPAMSLVYFNNIYFPSYMLNFFYLFFQNLTKIIGNSVELPKRASWYFLFKGKLNYKNTAIV